MLEHNSNLTTQNLKSKGSIPESYSTYKLFSDTSKAIVTTKRLSNSNENTILDDLQPSSNNESASNDSPSSKKKNYLMDLNAVR